MKYDLDFLIKKISKTKVNISIENLGQVQSFFEWVKLGYERDEKPQSLLAIYLYENIAKTSVRKRKVTAREYEDYLATVFSGVVTDEDTRTNNEILIYGQPKEVLEFISSNQREKVDVIFPSGYGLTVKTSMPDNMEINMGSFERSALFYNFLDLTEYGGERKSGLGSRSQISQTLTKIFAKGLWSEFLARYSVMVDNIFKDDMLFTVKGGDYIETFFIHNSVLRDLLKKDLETGPSGLETINRYEGNSIRIDRRLLLANSQSIKIDFSDISLNKTYQFLLDLDTKVLELLSEYLDDNVTI